MPFFFKQKTAYEITVENPGGVCRGVAVLELDGVAVAVGTGVALVDDGKIHQVRVVLGGSKVPATAGAT